MINEFYLVSNHVKINIISHSIENPSCILIHLHGLCSHFQNHSGMYNDFEKRIMFFKKINILSYALEFEGCGKSDGERGYIPSFKNYENNFKTLYNYIKYKHPNKKIFILAESMGACVIIKSLISDCFNICGVILLAPLCGIGSEVKVSNTYLNFFKMLSYIKPRFKIKNNNIQLGCNNIKYNMLNEVNDYSYKDSYNISLLRECYDNFTYNNLNAHKINTPFLAIHSKLDKVTCYKKTIHFINMISSDDKEVFLLDKGHHGLLISEHDYDYKPYVVLSKITNWINNRI